MKTTAAIFLGAAVLLGVGAGSYWFGAHTVVPPPSAPAPATNANTEHKVLYYRNPMDPADTSPVPKQDAMGMKYVPVYEGDADFEVKGGNQISIGIEKVQKLGVKSEAATLRMLDKTIRAAGRVEIDERRTYTIAPKFEGWVERLYVNASGQPVSKGQPLFDVYSPELVSAQREYALAAQGMASLRQADSDARNSMEQLAEASMARLRNWGITEAQIRQLASGNAKRSLTFHAPVSGIVLEKKAVQGMRFMPGDVLYQIADLSSVWVVAEVAEQDIGLVKAGSAAQVSIEAYPDRRFAGKVNFVYPTLNTATRTVAVRVEIANPKGLLKPAMFARVELTAAEGGKVLTVPASAVIDSGTRQVVLVQLGEGRFESRSVHLGRRGENYVEVLEGIAAGEQVVTSALFLIDAESNLKAALGGLGGHAAHGGSAPAGQKQPDTTKQPGTSADGHAEHGAVAQPGNKPAAVGYQAQGTLNAVNADGTVNITHGPIEALDWPGMTMDFMPANSSLAGNARIGSAITFEIVERKPGEWVITKLQAKPHEGH